MAASASGHSLVVFAVSRAVETCLIASPALFLRFLPSSNKVGSSAASSALSMAAKEGEGEEERARVEGVQSRGSVKGAARGDGYEANRRSRRPEILRGGALRAAARAGRRQCRAPSRACENELCGMLLQSPDSRSPQASDLQHNKHFAAHSAFIQPSATIAFRFGEQLFVEAASGG